MHNEVGEKTRNKVHLLAWWWRGRGRGGWLQQAQSITSTEESIGFQVLQRSLLDVLFLVLHEKECFQVRTYVLYTTQLHMWLSYQTETLHSKSSVAHVTKWRTDLPTDYLGRTIQNRNRAANDCCAHSRKWSYVAVLSGVYCHVNLMFATQARAQCICNFGVSCAL